MTSELLLELIAFAGIMRIAWTIRADVSTVIADISTMKGRQEDHESRIRTLEAESRGS